MRSFALFCPQSERNQPIFPPFGRVLESFRESFWDFGRFLGVSGEFGGSFCVIRYFFYVFWGENRGEFGENWYFWGEFLRSRDATRRVPTNDEVALLFQHLHEAVRYLLIL